MTYQPDATGLVENLSAGKREVADELMTLVYDELRDLAGGHMRHERSDHTLQPTALVHEAYLKMVIQTRVDWKGKTHFKAVAATAMYRYLVDYARARKRKKRGGDMARVALEDAFQLVEGRPLDVLALHDGLERLRTLDPQQAAVIEYRIFGDLDNEQVALILEVPARVTAGKFRGGLAWLRRELGPGDNE